MEKEAVMEKKVGLIVNPLAGLGGAVGLKGSDGPDILRRAFELGGKPQAPARARLALEQLAELQPLPHFYCYGGAMGGDILDELGYPHTLLGYAAGESSTAEDTVAAARAMAETGVDLLIFAGGDGTARDISAAIGEKLVVLGVPAGVKIHSAAYAVNPLNAGLAARDFLSGRISNTRRAQVMDIDEELFRSGQVNSRLYGYLLTPEDSERLQAGKSGRHGGAEELDGMAAYVAGSMRPGCLYLIGPGSTTKAVMDELGLPDTLLGVDAVLDGRLIASDLNAADIRQLLDSHSGEVNIIVTVIGGQGNLFGRGNQQFSPDILRRVGRRNIIVISGGDKLAALEGRPLRLDTGDPELDAAFSGYLEVIVDDSQYTLVKVSG